MNIAANKTNVIIMRCRQSRAQLARYIKRLGSMQTPDPLQERCQVFAIDVFHREKVTAFKFADVVDAADIRMGHLPGDSHLGEQPFAPDGIVGKRLGQELQCNGLAQLQVIGSIDFAHATAAEQPDDAVAVGQDRSGSESSGRNRIG